MPRLVCTTDQLTYNNKVYGKGDTFSTVGENADEDARLLKGFGKAEDAPARQVNYEGRSLNASSPQDKQVKTGRGRHYDRRDMQAKED